MDLGSTGPNATQISHTNQPSPIPAKTASERQHTLRDPEVASKNSSSFSSRQPTAVDPQTGAGTDAAKQHARMSAAPKEPTPEQTMPVATPLSTSAVVSVPRVVVASPTRDFPSADREPTEGVAPGEKMGQTNQSSAEFLILSSQDARPAENDGTPAKVTQLFKAITETIERLHTDSHTNVEMKVKLPDGQQLTVRLQLHAGEVRAVFRTDSAEWREAITRGWSDIAGNSAEHGVRLTDPAFESPGTQAGFDNLNQQPRDRRDDAESTANDAPFVPGSKKNPKTKAPPTSPKESLSPSRPTKLGAAGLVAWA